MQAIFLKMERRQNAEQDTPSKAVCALLFTPPPPPPPPPPTPPTPVCAAELNGPDGPGAPAFRAVGGFEAAIAPRCSGKMHPNSADRLQASTNPPVQTRWSGATLASALLGGISAAWRDQRAGRADMARSTCVKSDLGRAGALSDDAAAGVDVV